MRSVIQILITLLLLSFGNIMLRAQINPHLDFQYDVQKFTVDDGLPGNTVNAIAKDSLGYLWFATAGGLARFDGHRFETIPLPEDSVGGSADLYILHVQYVPNRGLYVSTKTRIYVYNPYTEIWKSINADKMMLHYSGLPSSYIHPFSDSLLATSNTIQKKGVVTLSKEGNLTPLLNEFAFDMDSFNDTLWVMTQHHIISIDKRFGKKHFSHSIPYDSSAYNLYLKKHRKAPGFYALKRMFSSDKTRRAIIYNMELLQKRTIHTTIDTLPDVNGFLEVKPHVLALTTEYNGLIFLDTKSGKRINAEDIPELKPYFNQFLTRFIYKFDDTMWIGGNGTGVIKIDLKSRRFQKLTNGTKIGKAVISNLVKTIRTDGDNLWVLNHNEPFGIYSINLTRQTGEFYQFATKDGFQASIDFEFLNKEWIVVGSLDGGLSAMDRKGARKKQIAINYELPFKKSVTTSNIPYYGIIDRDKEGLWLGSAYQLFHINHQLQEDKNYSFLTDSPILKNAMWQMGGFVDSVRNGLWLTVSSSIRFFDFKTEEQTSFTLPEFLSNDTKHISLIKRNDALNNNLWITSENGLIYYEPESKRRRYFSTKDGLPNNFIYGLLTDKRGDLWLSTNKGLSRAHIAVDDENLPVLTFRNYTVKDGLQSNEFNSFGYHEDENGQFWFSGVGGINWFHPDSIKDDLVTPIPIIKQVNVFNKPFAVDTSYNFKKTYAFDYEQSDFSIEYSGITYRRADEVTYAYQLVGQDPDWVESGKETRTRYTNLRPGLFKFQVKAANYDGIWSEPKSIWIRVNAPFWLKPWFFVLFGLFIIGLIYSSVRYLSAKKLKKLLEELEKRELINNERARIAKDLHDELGANLTQISLLSELVQREIQSAGKTSTPLKKVAEAAKTGVTNLSEIVWSLNPKNDSLENVVAYIQEYADGYFNGTSIRVLFDIDESFPEKIVSSDVRHALLMTIKECLNNALKYSEATTIWIHIHFENNTLTIVIQENGKGFNLDEKMHEGNGILHQLSRLKAFGGKVQIDTALGSGCETQIQIPIKVE